MLIRQLIANINRRSTIIGGSGVKFSFHTSSALGISDDEVPVRKPRKLKEWRKHHEAAPSIMQLFETPMPKGKKYTIPRRKILYSPIELRMWWNAQKNNYEKFSQEFMTERHETLGCDLAAAHFLVHRGGKVKFYSQKNWIAKDEKGQYELPLNYNPNWRLTDLDASGVHIYYEGLENFINLVMLKWASFKGNKFFDDWALDRILVQFPNLEYLDVSECKRLTERGLEAIYRHDKLKTIIITDWDKKPSFELTCLMLEDCCPHITLKVQDPEKKEIE